MTEVAEKKNVQYECKNAMYFKAKDYSGDDIILVNERIHHPNGKIEKNLRQILNYQKEIFIHKEGYRKYTQKQVWKPKSEMIVYRTTEAKLDDQIKLALGIPLNRYMSRRQLCRSPYVYGTDISTTSIIKNKYQQTFPDAVSINDVAVLDIETNVFTGKGEIIAITLSYKDKAIVCTTKEFIGTTVSPESKFYKKLDELLPFVRKPKTNPEDNQNRGCNVEFKICETPARACLAVLAKAHEWKPDFVIGWNLMGFDIPKIIEALEDEGYKPEDAFSDPSVHPRFRTCYYKKGSTSKLTASGKYMPMAGYEQWHSLLCSSFFYFVDAMCLYYQIRKAGGKEENYALDTILNKFLDRGKLGIDEAAHLSGVDKHKFMQTNYKIEYLVYNLFDCIGLEMLDEVTADVSKTFTVLAGVSDYMNYSSNPKRLCDALHFFVYENPDFDGVLGTVSDELKTEMDNYVPSLKDWIVALPTERLIDNGLQNIKGMESIITKCHAQTSDIDISSSYPNTEITMNVSKDTTVHELYRIEGMSVEQQRVLGLNMIGGKVNAMEFATQVYKLPQANIAWETYKAERAKLY